MTNIWRGLAGLRISVASLGIVHGNSPDMGYNHWSLTTVVLVRIGLRTNISILERAQVVFRGFSS